MTQALKSSFFQPDIVRPDLGSLHQDTLTPLSLVHIEGTTDMAEDEAPNDVMAPAGHMPLTDECHQYEGWEEMPPEISKYVNFPRLKCLNRQSERGRL